VFHVYNKIVDKLQYSTQLTAFVHSYTHQRLRFGSFPPTLRGV